MVRRTVEPNDEAVTVTWYETGNTNAGEWVLILGLYAESGERRAWFEANRALTELKGEDMQDARDYLSASQMDVAALTEAIAIAEAWERDGTLPED